LARRPCLRDLQDDREGTTPPWSSTGFKHCSDVGARWSNDLKDYAGTQSCELPHVALVLSGRLHVVMDDGSEEEFGPNQVMLLPPGHDAWTVGGEPCVFVEFSRGNDYYS
jgi:hypothetical protein